MSPRPQHDPGRPGATAATALAVALALVLGLSLVTAAGAASLSGTVSVVDERGRAIRGAAAETVVWFEPDRPAGEPAVTTEPEREEMITVRKRFIPRVLVVPTGSTVEFPNRDPILHNVFSISGENRFDLGLVPRGEGGSHTFVEPGVVRVFCNVHHDMVAYVVVVDTPHFGSPAKDGRFRLSGVPEGPGTLHVWHERGQVSKMRVDSSGPPVRLQVRATRPLVPPHLNKAGRPYSRSRRSRY